LPPDWSANFANEDQREKSRLIKESEDLALTAETVNPLDIDERPPPIMKLTDAQQHAQLLATFFMDNSLDFTPIDPMKLQGMLEKLNKIFVANLKWQHQRTVDSFFKFT
jgi:hypothetical protein